MSIQNHCTVLRAETGDRRCDSTDWRPRICDGRVGFTIVECLMALAISAILLTAVAVAFNASVINYTENEQMYRAINNARQALTRMTSQLRTGYAVDPSAAGNRCNFFTVANQDLSYEFRSTDNRLYLITNSDHREYVLCNNVIAANFDKTPADSGMDSKSVQITLTVRAGDFQRTLAAGVVIRRNVSL